jgi:DNA repair photolyase
MIEEIRAKSILNPTGGFLSTYTHSLNAYQGCAFGKGSCPYCYVRAMPIQRFAGRPWGEWVKAKVNAPELLRQELETAKRKGAFGALRIFMSTATDPYQGAEARLKLTRGVLEVFAESGRFGLLVVQTRSPLIERDLDLLQTLGSSVAVSFTIYDRDQPGLAAKADHADFGQHRTSSGYTGQIDGCRIEDSGCDQPSIALRSGRFCRINFATRRPGRGRYAAIRRRR